MRKKQEILDEIKFILDIYEYDVLRSVSSSTCPGEKDPQRIKQNAEDNRKMKKYMKELEKKYGKKNLDLRDTYVFANLHGRIDALQWVLGGEANKYKHIKNL